MDILDMLNLSDWDKRWAWLLLSHHKVADTIWKVSWYYNNSTYFLALVFLAPNIFLNILLFWKNYMQTDPPSNKTSWRVRLKWNIQRRLCGTSPRRQWYVFTTSYWYVMTTSQGNVMTTSHQYVSTTSQISLKWNTQRRLSGTYPRRPISTSLRRLL